MKYFTRTITIAGSLTIGVVAENIDDARKIFDSVIEDKDYSLYDMQVDVTSWDESEDEEVDERELFMADYRLDELESQEVLDYVNEKEDEDD